MKEEATYKLDRIADIWNSFIWEYEFCKRKIKFTPEVQTNYFGDILGYFQDTFDLIFNKRISHSYTDRFSTQISLLQSIYVQQDFIEELLIIFNCKISKGDLKKDPNYSLNREIRNELVGHPIRKQNGQVISSCLFAYNKGNDKIVYLRYHKENNYKFESMEYPVSEIIIRHREFLNTYFDKILNKLRKILMQFVKEIENLENLIEKKSFNEILDLSQVFYESIFKYDFIYDRDSLEKIFLRKDEHRRYENLIEKFYSDLKSSLKEKKEYVVHLFEPRKETKNIEKPIFNFPFENEQKIELSDICEERPITYHYELGKIATKRNPWDFDFFGGSLRNKCADKKIVLEELDHMESNLLNDIEYYSAYKLICTELNEE